ICAYALSIRYLCGCRDFGVPGVIRGCSRPPISGGPPMAQPIRRNAGAVRAYSDQLRVLMSQLAADPLDVQKSIALVSHIVGRRSAAHPLLEDLQSQALGISC